MILYNLAIYIYSLLIRVASPFIPKAKLWVEGRKNIFEKLQEAISGDDKIVWMHVASLGEFEQGRPIMEQLHQEFPTHKILLTFYSPSGYELRKNYAGADYIFYLPLDTPRNARRFLDIVNPEIVIFIKYEYWLNFLSELRRRGVQTYIVSAIFRQNSIFFDAWGGMWRRALQTFNTIFVQNVESQRLLSTIGVENVVVAGDTRFDRVATIASGVRSLSFVEEFKGESRLFIAGSSWNQDDALIAKLAKGFTDVKFLIAPHEIDNSHVLEVMKSYGAGTLRYTEVMQLDDQRRVEALKNAQVLIVDTMGMLSSLYQYGDWGYIGGGFGVGIHNTLEAAIFALPIAFGPNYLRFKEAVDLVKVGSASPISNIEELEIWFYELYVNNARRARRGAKSKKYAVDNCGATTIFVDHLINRVK